MDIERASYMEMEYSSHISIQEELVQMDESYGRTMKVSIRKRSTFPSTISSATIVPL
jgi:hypothetical protein